MTTGLISGIDGHSIGKKDLSPVPLEESVASSYTMGVDAPEQSISYSLV